MATRNNANTGHSLASLTFLCYLWQSPHGPDEAEDSAHLAQEGYNLSVCDSYSCDGVAIEPSRLVKCGPQPKLFQCGHAQESRFLLGGVRRRN
jgi:hypothetical protein